MGMFFGVPVTLGHVPRWRLGMGMFFGVPVTLGTCASVEAGDGHVPWSAQNREHMCPARRPRMDILVLCPSHGGGGGHVPGSPQPSAESLGTSLNPTCPSQPATLSHVACHTPELDVSLGLPETLNTCPVARARDGHSGAMSIPGGRRRACSARRSSAMALAPWHRRGLCMSRGVG